MSFVLNIREPALWNATWWRPSFGGFHRVKILYFFPAPKLGTRPQGGESEGPILNLFT